MNKVLLCLLFSPLYCSVPPVPDFDDFTPSEQKKIAQSMSHLVPKSTIILPTMSVTFDIIVDGDSILYDCPVFTLDGKEVICQVCGKPPVQIEVTNGKLRCYCFNHIPRKRGSFLD
jgi:hypothetical protein